MAPLAAPISASLCRFQASDPWSALTDRGDVSELPNKSAVGAVIGCGRCRRRCYRARLLCGAEMLNVVYGLPFLSYCVAFSLGSAETEASGSRGRRRLIGLYSFPQGWVVFRIVPMYFRYYPYTILGVIKCDIEHSWRWESYAKSMSLAALR